MSQWDNIKWRYRSVIFILLLAVAGLFVRIIYLGVIDRHFLMHQSTSRALRNVEIPAHRGMIIDRLGEPLAVSTPVDSVWVNPKLLTITDSQVIALSKILGTPLAKINKQLSINTKKHFIYLKRGVPPSKAQAIKELKIPGVYLQREYRRYYPQGAVTSHIVGFTNIDDKGQEGLELAFDRMLRGVPGKKWVMKDRRGDIIADVNVESLPQQGKDVQLSVDHRIQYLAYREIQDAMKKFGTKSGSIVVLDVKTGEVLAMVNAPDYNPNRRTSKHDGRYRNRAVTDIFEPGSTMKAFSILSAFESGKYDENTLVDTNPGWFTMNGYTISDHGHNLGVVPVSTVMQKSSNVGVARMSTSLPLNHLWEVLDSLGFGKSTDSGFPGEVSGKLVRRHKWMPINIVSLSFGYGVAVTGLQLARAYAAIANHGVEMPISFTKLDIPPLGKQVIPESIADRMVKLLQKVLVTGGTGRRARVPGYQVAGKTGTAYIAGKNGYDEKHHHYTASFVGIAPASDPRVVVAVILRDPVTKAHFGGQVAAPTFSRVMAGAMRYLSIPPDDIGN